MAYEEKTSLKQKTIRGFGWKLSQSVGTQLINFVISIVLARILSPSDYGIIALTTAFISIANIFVTTGFSSAIIQRSELTNEEISAVFYIGVAVAVTISVAICLLSPLIADYYNEPILIYIMRVQSISIVISAFSSVPVALISRRMQYKKGFVISLSASVAHGIVGISMALMGFGVWALVISNLANTVVACIANYLVIKWKPGKCCSLKKVRPLFEFSSKILLSNLLNAVYVNYKTLIVGKVFDRNTLGFFDKGQQFPALIMTNIDGAMRTVLFSTLSKVQDDETLWLRYLRKSIKVSMYICAPLMAGLAAVAEPMVFVLLTDKWLPIVPFIRIFAATCAFWPMYAKITAIQSTGNSTLTLIIDGFSVALSVAGLLIAIPYGITMLALSNLFCTILGVIAVMFISVRVLGYRICDQLKDIAAPLLLSAVMGFGTYALSLIPLPSAITLSIQVVSGVVLYILLSCIFKVDSYFFVLSFIRETLKSLKKRGDKNV